MKRGIHAYFYRRKFGNLKNWEPNQETPQLFFFSSDNGVPELESPKLGVPVFELFFVPNKGSFRLVSTQRHPTLGDWGFGGNYAYSDSVEFQSISSEPIAIYDSPD